MTKEAYDPTGRAGVDIAGKSRGCGWGTVAVSRYLANALSLRPFLSGDQQNKRKGLQAVHVTVMDQRDAKGEPPQDPHNISYQATVGATNASLHIVVNDPERFLVEAQPTGVINPKAASDELGHALCEKWRKDTMVRRIGMGALAILIAGSEVHDQRPFVGGAILLGALVIGKVFKSRAYGARYKLAEDVAEDVSAAIAEARSRPQ